MSDLTFDKLQFYIDRLGDLKDEGAKMCSTAQSLRDVCPSMSSTVGMRIKDLCRRLTAMGVFARKSQAMLIDYYGDFSAAMATAKEGSPKGVYIQKVWDVGAPRVKKEVERAVEDLLRTLSESARELQSVRESSKSISSGESLESTLGRLQSVCNVAGGTLREVMDGGGKGKKAHRATTGASEDPGDESKGPIEEGEENMGWDPGHESPDGQGWDPGHVVEGSTVTGASEDPGDESKGPIEEGEENMGWDPGHESPDGQGWDPGHVVEGSDVALERQIGAHTFTQADSRTPGNESLGPLDEGEEDMGWIPGHRTPQNKAKKPLRCPQGGGND